jgi:hypothetical protein
VSEPVRPRAGPSFETVASERLEHRERKRRLTHATLNDCWQTICSPPSASDRCARVHGRSGTGTRLPAHPQRRPGAHDPTPATPSAASSTVTAARRWAARQGRARVHGPGTPPLRAAPDAGSGARAQLLGQVITAARRCCRRGPCCKRSRAGAGSGPDRCGGLRRSSPARATRPKRSTAPRSQPRRSASCTGRAARGPVGAHAAMTLPPRPGGP